MRRYPDPEQVSVNGDRDQQCDVAAVAAVVEPGRQRVQSQFTVADGDTDLRVAELQPGHKQLPGLQLPPDLLALEFLLRHGDFLGPAVFRRRLHVAVQVDLVEIHLGHAARRAFRCQGGVSAEHRPADTVFGGNVDQAVGRHPAAVASASGLGDPVGDDFTGRSIESVVDEVDKVI